MKIGIIGVGNLGSSIANGILKSNAQAENLILSDCKSTLLEKHSSTGAILTMSNKKLTKLSDIIIIAVKPFKLEEVLNEIQPHLSSKKILISVVTGRSIYDISQAINQSIPIVRAMPNTAISTQESITCIAHQNISSEQLKKVVSIFDNLGETVEIDEQLMNAATVLGACGIAYVMRFLRAMTQGGIEIGFSAETANRIAIQTMKGATELLLKNGTHPEQEIDKVTTPRGCTIAGLNEMEHQGFSSALIKGIKTSFESI